MRWHERFMLVQTLVTLGLCVLSMGGRAFWAKELTLLCAVLALLPTIFPHTPGETIRHSRKKRLLPHLPLVCFLLYLTVAYFNPSHFPMPGGGWQPRPEWIPGLPTCLDETLALSDALPWLAGLLQAGALVAATRHNRTHRLLALGIAWLTVGLAVFGAVLFFLGADRVMGLFYVPGSTHFATFIYKNHWTAFALLGACTALGIGFSGWERASEERSAKAQRLYGFAVAGLILLTLPLPGSRAGTILGLGLLIIALFAAASRVFRDPQKSAAMRRWGIVGIGIIAFGLISYTAWVGAKSIDTKIIGRTEQLWEREQSLDFILGGRLEVASCTWTMGSVRPFWGWGLGSFEPVFQLFESQRVKEITQGRTHFDVAHCDWMQIPTEMGRITAVVMLGFILWLTYMILRWGGTLAKWQLLGVWIILVLATGEFPLQNPAVLLLFCITFGTAYAQARLIRAKKLHIPKRSKRRSSSVPS